MEDGQVVTEVKTGQRSKLGLSVKIGRDHGVVWVTSTDTGAPIAGAQVQVRSAELVRWATDGVGVAVLKPGVTVANPEDDKPQFLEVRAWRRRDVSLVELRNDRSLASPGIHGLLSKVQDRRRSSLPSATYFVPANRFRSRATCAGRHARGARCYLRRRLRFG